MDEEKLKAAAELLGVTVERVEEMMKESFDGTTPTCDICGTRDDKIKGGVILLEKDGSFTAECQECWNSFTNIPPERRVAKNILFKTAIEKKIGTDAECVYEYLHSGKTFRTNVLDFLARQGSNGKIYVDRQTMEFCKNPQRAHPVTNRCPGCSETKNIKEMKKCGGCHLVNYCNATCQKRDWKRHKKSCMEYQNIHRESSKYPAVV